VKRFDKVKEAMLFLAAQSTKNILSSEIRKLKRANVKNVLTSKEIILKSILLLVLFCLISFEAFVYSELNTTLCKSKVVHLHLLLLI